MSIVLTPEQEQFVREQMARGPFKSPDEVLEQAFRLLQEKYQEYESWIEVVRDQVNEAAAELERGEGIPLDTVMEQLQDKFRQAKKLGN
jgi:antitoxin ParD1/3/4